MILSFVCVCVCVISMTVLLWCHMADIFPCALAARVATDLRSNETDCVITY